VTGHTQPSLRPLPLFVSTLGTAQLLGALFVVMAAASWIAAGYDLGELQVSSAMQKGLELDARQRAAHSEAGRLLGWAQLGCAGVVATLFLPWLYHARVNVRALGARRLRYPREWAYLAFLVPGLNLIRPLQVLSEVWRASAPDTEHPLAWQGRPTPGLAWAWWGLLCAWPVLEASSALLLQHAADPARLQLGHGLSLLGNACAAGSATAAYFLVNRISGDQESKWRTYGDCALPETTLAHQAPELST